MDRTELMAIRDSVISRDTRPDSAQLSQLEQKLRVELRKPSGKRALIDAPRSFYTDMGELKGKQMTEDDAVDALLEELDAAL